MFYNTTIGWLYVCSSLVSVLFYFVTTITLEQVISVCFKNIYVQTFKKFFFCLCPLVLGGCYDSRSCCLLKMFKLNRNLPSCLWETL